MRNFKLLILSILLTFFLLGCSSNSKEPISPVVGENSAWHNATSMSGGTVVDDSYWNDTLIVRDKVWVAHRNLNSSIHYALGPGIEVSSDPLDVISEFSNIFLLPADNFRISSDETHAGLRIVMLRQYYENLRVWPSMVQIVYGRNGKFLKAIADVFPITNLNTNPVLSPAQAENITLGETGESNIEACELVVYATQDSNFPAYRVKTFEWIYFIDADNGSVLNREHLQWDTYEGNVTGYASAPNPHEP
ncbi:MAG: hypothetical protein ABIG42_05325, partial [bacterium]